MYNGLLYCELCGESCKKQIEHKDYICELETENFCIKKLAFLEEALARRLNLPCNESLHDKLVEIDKNNLLHENEIVAKWHEALADLAQFKGWEKEQSDVKKN